MVDEDGKVSAVNNLNGKTSWFLTEDGIYEILMRQSPNSGKGS
ncbi:hypothetical protein [Bacillus toyonensis]|nr:hypothetical protein [Bacillus toyonensis]